MRRVVLLIAMVLCAFSALATSPLQAGAPLDVPKIKAALETATPEEHGFIQHVSDLIVRDVLPREMFQSTFLWARKKPKNKFQYFKRGLIMRAAKAGIQI